MNQPTRLLLSSLLLAVGGCTPSAMATPSPEREVLTPAEPVRFAVVGSEPGDTLSVKIHGPARVSTPFTVTYSATVERGTAKRYYYWWFVAACATRNGCAPSSYQLLDEGEARTSVKLPFGANNAEKDLVVQVAEIGGKGRTGSSVEYPIMGPAQRMSGGGGVDGFTGGVCDWYAGSFYPHTGKYVDPFTGRSWERGFRRDYCGNRVSWDPNR